LSLLAPAFLLLTNTVTVHAQTPNPAAYLTFDEGTGTVAHDASGDNNDATLLGGRWLDHRLGGDRVHSI
jgi:hypothetical protein